MLSERFEMRFTADLLRQIDEWRRQQPDLPARAEAIRRLIEASLKAPSGTPSGGTGSGGAKKPATAGKTAAPRPRKAGQERKAAPATPTSKEAQLRALREQTAR